MNLNDPFYSGVCVFGRNGLGKLQPIFQGRNKQIVQRSCIAYYVPRITDSCKESAKIYLIPLQIKIMVHRRRLCFRAPDVLERTVIQRKKFEP